MPFLIVGVFLFAAVAGGDPLPSGETRAGLIAGYRLVLSANDRDGDHRLSREEWTQMVSVGFPEQPRETPPPGNYAQARNSILAFYADQDRNQDGYLDLAELLRVPLAHFACADTNRDGRMSRREQGRAMLRCPALGVAVNSEQVSAPSAH